MECPYCKTENLEGATKCAACSSWMVEKPPVREWTRAVEGRRVAGVCRGLANRFGVPVAALRLMFIGSIAFGGWGILAYLALWIALPLEGAQAAARAHVEADVEVEAGMAAEPSAWTPPAPEAPRPPVGRGEPVLVEPMSP